MMNVTTVDTHSNRLWLCLLFIICYQFMHGIYSYMSETKHIFGL